MKVAHALALIALSHIALRCSAAPEIVLFGDSLSDNGNGYAGNAKFVLRTNQASSHRPIWKIVKPPLLAWGAHLLLRFPDLYQLSLQTYPESPYYSGRWSNGPTWIEVAASLLGASLTDYGAGLCVPPSKRNVLMQMSR